MNVETISPLQGRHRYVFHFKVGELDFGVYDDIVILNPAEPLDFHTIEQVWDDIAEQHSQGFWRVGLEHHGPHCLIPSYKLPVVHEPF